MEDIKVWAQMFFEDGSVTQGIRIPAEWLEEGLKFKIKEVGYKLLNSVNREEGYMLIWGAGNMVFKYLSISCETTESETSA